MKVIKPVEFTVDASTIDIDSDGYEEWETGLPLEQLVVLGMPGALNPFFNVYSQTGDTLTKESDRVDIIDSSTIWSTTRTKDGRYLIAGNADGYVYLYKRDINKFVFKQKIKVGIDRCQGLSIRNGYLVAGFLNLPYLAWFRMEEGRLIQLPSPDIYERITTNTANWISDDIFLLTRNTGSKSANTFFERIGNSLSIPYVSLDAEGIKDTDVWEKPSILFFVTQNSPHFQIFASEVIEDGYENVYSDTGLSSYTQVSVSPSGEYIAVGGSTSHGGVSVFIYKKSDWDDYTKLTNPTAQNVGDPQDFDWDTTSTYLYVAGLTGDFEVYKRTADTFATVATPASPDSTVYTITHFPASGYLQGDIVRRGNDLYESLMNDNQSNDPATEISTSPTWLHIGKVNKYRMFDDKLSTLSIQPGTTGQSYTLFLNSATEGFFTLTYIEEYEWKYGTAFGQVSENIRTFSFPHDVTAPTLQSTLEAVYGKGLVTVTAATDFTIAFDPVIGDARLHLGTYALGGATPTLTMPQAFVTANLVVTLTPLEAGSDHVYLFGLDATSVTIQHFESNGTTQVSTSGAIDVTDKKSTSRALTRAMTANEKIKITIANTATTAKCGKVIIGESVIEKAKTQWGITPEIKSYGRRNIDDFGQAYLKKGNVAKKVRASCILDSDADADEIFEVLNQLDNLPAVYDFNGATTTYSTLHFYGIYLDGRMPFQGLNHTKLTLDILGLI